MYTPSWEEGWRLRSASLRRPPSSLKLIGLYPRQVADKNGKDRIRCLNMKNITQQNYHEDKMFPGIQKAVHDILQNGFVVTPIDVLVRTSRLTKKQVNEWRFGKIDYLERVLAGNLSQFSRLLRILARHCQAMGLKPSATIYTRWGVHGKRPPLRFTKSGEPHLEAAYSCHFISSYRPEMKAVEESKQQEVGRQHDK